MDGAGVTFFFLCAHGNASLDCPTCGWLYKRIAELEAERDALKADVNALNELLRVETGMGQGEIDAAIDAAKANSA